MSPARGSTSAPCPNTIGYRYNQQIGAEMLPLLHQQRYEELKQRFEQISQSIFQSVEDLVTLRSTVTQLQEFFQHQVSSLSMDGLAGADEQRLYALQVEIDKQLRLLGMDAMFLQAAKQSTTVGQRQNQVNDRLQTLIRYCEAVLQI